MEFISTNTEETAKYAQDIFNSLKQSNQATVLALYGDLGSGKTTFTQFLAKELGIADYITSPTFVIEKRYNCAAEKLFKKLIHIDCYRLSKPDEMIHLGWPEIVADSGNIIVVEWPERIESILPENSIRISFEYVGETKRKISIINKNGEQK